MWSLPKTVLESLQDRTLIQSSNETLIRHLALTYHQVSCHGRVELKLLLLRKDILPMDMV